MYCVCLGAGRYEEYREEVTGRGRNCVMRNCVIFALRRILLGYHIKRDERNRACSMHVTDVNTESVLVVNPEECRPVRRRRRKREEIIKMSVRIYVWKA